EQESASLCQGGEQESASLYQGGEQESASLCQGGGQDRIQNPQEWVEKVVRLKIVENWESQDVPEHLSTIRDRLLKENQRIVRRLGLYQQILEQVEIVPDGSPEQMELRLSGLIVKHGDKLTLSNSIYQAIFNKTLIEKELEKLSPYSESIKAWLNSDGQDDSQLLRGDDLQSALVWAADKSLRNEDFHFLTSSQKLILSDQNQLLHLAQVETKIAHVEADSAKQKAKHWIGIGSAILAASLIGAIGFSTLAYQRFKLAQASIEVEQTASDALLLAVSQKTENSQALSEALLKAIASGNNLKTLVKNKPELEKYPATIPLLALQVILDKISGQQQGKKISILQKKMTWQAHTGAVTSVSFSPNEQFLATTGIDNRVRIWNLSGKKIAEWKALQQSVNIVNFSPNGKFLATAGRDSTVKFWNLSGKKISEFSAIQGSVSSISFSPDQNLLAVAGINNSAAIWQVSQLPKIESSPVALPGHNGLIRSVNFSKDGDFLTTLDGKSTVRIWNLSGKLMKKLPIQAIGISFSLNQEQQRFATVTLNGKVGLWNLSRQELVSEFQTLHLDTKSISFSPDGQHLATVGIDKTVRLWNLAGRQVAQFELEENVVSVSWSRDGRQIAIAGSNGTVWLRQVEGLEELLKQSCNYFINQPEYSTRVSTLCK
ncbi:WD40 repeat domain-containing protein, partial [Tychonema sp. BBK16]